jgi:adenine-specific DNA-methyltransferase
MPFLDWVNKNQAKETTREVPYHLLKQESVHGDVSGANADNLLIQGDNLLALKALIPFYAGRVKCIFIDPPYNTQSAFEHYDDKLEHSQWLSMMYPRLVLLRELLAEDGSIWVSIDDNEGHYLKVLMDEVFGRENFVSSVIWQKKYAPKSDSKYLSESHDFILGYARKLGSLSINRIVKGDKQTSRYTNRDNDPRGAWKASDVLRSEARDYAIFPVILPSGKEVWPPSGTSWRYTKEKFAELVADNRIWFGIDGNARPAYKRFLSEVTDSMPATTIWAFDEVGHNDESKKEMRSLFGEDLFGTPKPERLLHRVLHIATNEGDLVLDSFLGSGTTTAVAHKMGRRYIGIEMGEHARTHCAPRLQKVT